MKKKKHYLIQPKMYHHLNNNLITKESNICQLSKKNLQNILNQIAKNKMREKKIWKMTKNYFNHKYKIAF